MYKETATLDEKRKVLHQQLKKFKAPKLLLDKALMDKWFIEEAYLRIDTLDKIDFSQDPLAIVTALTTE